MTGYYPEGRLITTAENIAAMQSMSSLTDAYHEGRILEGRAVVCDSAHNLIVDLGIMKGIIPREEGAIGIREGTVRDIAVISRVPSYQEGLPRKDVCMNISKPLFPVILLMQK